MANRRNLKKEINGICGDLFAECVAINLRKGDGDRSLTDGLMTEILKLQDDFISRVSHTQKDKVRKFYNHLYADFNAKTANIIEALDKLG